MHEQARRHQAVKAAAPARARERATHRTRGRSGAALAQGLRDCDLSPDELVVVIAMLAGSEYSDYGTAVHPAVRELPLAERVRIANSLGPFTQHGDGLSDADRHELRLAREAIVDPRDTLGILALGGAA